MADELTVLINELQQIQKETTAASQRIIELTNSLARLNAESLKTGGGGLAGAVGRYTQQAPLIAAGGVPIQGPTQQNINAEIERLRFEVKNLEARRQALTSVSKGLAVPVETRNIQQEIEESSKNPELVQRLKILQSINSSEELIAHEKQQELELAAQIVNAEKERIKAEQEVVRKTQEAILENASPAVAARYTGLQNVTEREYLKQEFSAEANRLMQEDIQKIELQQQKHAELIKAAEEQVRLEQERVAAEKKLNTQIQEEILATASPEMRARYLNTIPALPPGPIATSTNPNITVKTGIGTTAPGTLQEAEVGLAKANLEAITKEVNALGLSAENSQKLISVLNSAYEQNQMSAMDLNTSLKILEGGFVEVTQATTKAGVAQKTGKKMYVSSDLNKMISDAEVELQQRILNAQKFTGPTGYQNAMNLATQSGFQPTNLKRVTKEMPANVTTLEFQKEFNGVIEKGTITVDQFGIAMERTNRRLLNFKDSIIKNTIELIKWSIGIGLVYGTMYKFQQLVALAIDNQTKLVDISVSLGEAQRTTASIFEDASEVASRTGENINEVLQTYSEAYRATGGITDSIERLTSANKLLYDSTILNKLSGLSASESIDILSGALRQTTKAGESASQTFDRGAEMLDKWVAVARNANVDLATLATAFSVTAESALNSGMSIDQLNAVIAALSEKMGTLGGKEAGNAVRALIGGVYQQQSVDILNRYGIAVQDSTGKMRDFMTISKDIYDLYRAGLIDDAQLNKIGYTLGGGVRRGQQYVAFLKDQNRIQELVTISQQANGQAAEVLAKKMETVQTSTVMVSNAFQHLAQTMGNEGGLLSSLSGANKLLTLLIGGLDKLVGALGAVTIPAALLTLFSLYTNFGRDIGKTEKSLSLFANVGNTIGRIGAQRTGWTATINGQDVGTTSMVPNPTMAKMGSVVTQYGAAMALGFLSVMPRVAEAMQGGDWKAAATNMGGTIAGGVAGALVGGPMGAMIGTTIGGAIGDNFYKTVVGYKPKFEDFFKEVWKPVPKPGEVAAPTETIEETRARLEQEALKEYRRRFYQGPNPEQAAAGMNWLSQQPFAKYFGAQAPAGMQPKSEYTGATWMIEQLRKVEPEFVANLEKQLTKAKNLTPEEVTPLTSRAQEYERSGEKIFGDFIDTLAQKARDRLRDQLLKGEISGPKYVSAMQEVSGLPSSVVLWYGAINKMSKESTTLTKENQAEIKKLAGIYANIIPEEKQLVTDLTTQWRDLQDQWQSLSKMDPTTMLPDGNTVQEEQTKIQTSLRDTEQALADLQTSFENTKGLFKTPDFMQFPEMTPEAAQKVLDNAKKIQEAKTRYAGAKMGLSSQEIEENIRTQEQQAADVYVQLGKDLAFLIGKGIYDSNAIQQALEDVAQSLDWQSFSDVTSAQLSKIGIGVPGSLYQNMVDKLNAAASAQGMPSPVNETGSLVLTKDSTDPIYMKADWKIVQYLLTQILKTEEKQLDGIYNLPSGASFYVPFQAWKMDTETRKAMAQQGPTGPVSLDDRQFQSSVSNFDNAVNTFLQGIEKYYASLDPKRDLQLDKIFNEQIRAKTGALPFSTPIGTGDLGMQRYYHALNPRVDAVANAQNMYKMGNWFNQQPYINNLGYQINKVEPPVANPTPAYYEYLQKRYDTTRQVTPTTLTSPPNANLDMGRILAESIANGIKSFDWSAVGQSIIRGIESFLSGGEAMRPGAAGPHGIPNTGTTQPQAGVPQTAIPQLSTNLNLNLQTQTQLIVDGRTLADVIKPYLEQDLIQYQGAAGSATTYTFA